jgi:hypothetical protein
MLQFLALLLGSGISHASGYRDVSRPNQSYPIMAKYGSDGILRYCDGKRAGRPVPGWARADVPTPKTGEETSDGSLGFAIFLIVAVVILLIALTMCSGQ